MKTKIIALSVLLASSFSAQAAMSADQLADNMYLAVRCSEIYKSENSRKATTATIVSNTLMTQVMRLSNNDAYDFKDRYQQNESDFLLTDNVTFKISVCSTVF